jgi:hypothetical protein
MEPSLRGRDNFDHRARKNSCSDAITAARHNGGKRGEKASKDQRVGCHQALSVLDCQPAAGMANSSKAS